MAKMVCMLCGGEAGREHEKTARHQRAGAAWALHAIETRRCPWCAPSRVRGRVVPVRWPCGKHDAELAECRRLVADEPVTP
jgi:hypothetical protein